MKRLLLCILDLIGELRTINHQQKHIMTAIENLNQAVADNTAATAAVLAKLNAGNQDPAINSAAAQIGANTAALQAAVNPPATP